MMNVFNRKGRRKSGVTIWQTAGPQSAAGEWKVERGGRCFRLRAAGLGTAAGWGVSGLL